MISAYNRICYLPFTVLALASDGLTNFNVFNRRDYFLMPRQQSRYGRGWVSVRTASRKQMSRFLADFAVVNKVSIKKLEKKILLFIYLLWVAWILDRSFPGANHGL